MTAINKLEKLLKRKLEIRLLAQNFEKKYGSNKIAFAYHDYKSNIY